MANIPMGFCSCTEGVIKVPSIDIEHLIVAALKDLDFYLTPLGICHQLLLRNITDSFIRREKGMTIIEAKVTVLLHKAVFLVRVFLNQKSWNTSHATFIRLDRYSLTSICVPDTLTKVRPYCICMEHANKGWTKNISAEMFCLYRSKPPPSPLARIALFVTEPFLAKSAYLEISFEFSICFG